MVSKVVSHFGGCGFPAGRTIDEIDDLHHADRTTLSYLHGRFCSRKERGKFRVICRALSCRVHEFPAGAHNVKVPRPPLWADSAAGVQWNSFKAPAVGRLARRR